MIYFAPQLTSYGICHFCYDVHDFFYYDVQLPLEEEKL